jgi:hypothetical protein
MQTLLMISFIYPFTIQVIHNRSAFDPNHNFNTQDLAL